MVLSKRGYALKKKKKTKEGAEQDRFKLMSGRDGAWEERRERALQLFSPSASLAHSPDSWVARMKGARVAGQHADSAAGYCASKTLSYSKNIMIHLHTFSPQPNAHSHKHKPVDI